MNGNYKAFVTSTRCLRDSFRSGIDTSLTKFERGITQLNSKVEWNDLDVKNHSVKKPKQLRKIRQDKPLDGSGSAIDVDQVKTKKKQKVEEGITSDGDKKTQIKAETNVKKITNENKNAAQKNKKKKTNTNGNKKPYHMKENEQISKNDKSENKKKIFKKRRPLKSLKLGSVIDGTVVEIKEYGAFIQTRYAIKDKGW